MADKIVKFLAKLPARQRHMIEQIIEQLISGDLAGLDIRALKVNTSLLRVRAGSYRIIFTYKENGELMIITVARRDERTYKSL